jgi:hypothetical protein
MNFEDMQVIWDTQNDHELYAINRNALQRLVEKDSFAINRDLKGLELGAIVVLLGLGIATLIDTFFNGDEYFQLLGVAMEFIAAGCLWLRRNKRESGFKGEPASLLDHIETAMKRARATIHRGRDMAFFFAIFVFYGVGIRMMIYGWRGSEVKLALGVICVVLLFITFRVGEIRTHIPRLKNLESLQSKLLES